MGTRKEDGALVRPFWDSLTPECRSALLELKRLEPVRSFYLAGGTALALQIGHRVSRDLDWFSATNRLGYPERHRMISTLSAIRSFQLAGEQEGTLYALINGAEVSFIYQHHPLVQPVVEIEGTPIASLVDIGLMKLAAIKDRGMRRDFVDLFFLSRHVALEKLIDLVETKYTDRPDFLPTLARAMAYFEEAEEQPMPDLRENVSWEDVRRFSEEGARYIVRRGTGR